LYARSYLQDACLAEDIASESMIKLWENWDDTFSPIQRKTFLLTIVRNKCLDYFRKMQFSYEIQKDMADIAQRELNFRFTLLESADPQELFLSDIQTILEATLQQLPERTRLIFQLSRIENKTSREIAEELGISIKAVEYHITRSLTELRRNLKDYLPVVYFFIFL
jgi:RNA polymerase sigma-70 factor (ECF subfamily)